MNRIGKISVALFAAFVAAAPAIAGVDTGTVSSFLQPQYWVMAISTIALVSLGVGRNQVATAEAAQPLKAQQANLA